MADRDFVSAALLCGAIGALLFVVVFLVDGATRSGYNPVQQPVSALALGERGWIQITNFVVAGVLMGVFALGVHGAARGSGTFWGPALLGVFAVGLAASGVLVMDPVLGYPVDAAPGHGGATWHSVGHDVAGVLVFGALPAAAFVLAGAFWGMSGLRWLAVVSVVVGIAVAALFVTFSVILDGGGVTAGLWQRIAIIVGWSWIAVVAIALNARTTSGAP